MKVLYLPGLDGESHWVGSTQAQITGIQLVPFTYPSGRDLDWDGLTSLVVSRMGALQTGLLAGESFGGAVALKTAILHKAAVKGLCLISTFSHEAEPIASALGRVATRMLPAALLSPVARVLASWKLAGTLKGAERERFLRKFERIDHRELARRLKLLAGFDVSDRLVGITCPVEVLYGGKDGISADPRQLELWKRLPNAQIKGFDGYGHMITQEIPFEIARRMELWAQRVGATRA